jgi:hypothetical protein
LGPSSAFIQPGDPEGIIDLHRLAASQALGRGTRRAGQADDPHRNWHCIEAPDQDRQQQAETRVLDAKTTRMLTAPLQVSAIQVPQPLRDVGDGSWVTPAARSQESLVNTTEHGILEMTARI